MNSAAMYRSLTRPRPPDSGTHDSNGGAGVSGEGVAGVGLAGGGVAGGWRDELVVSDEEDDSWDDDDDDDSITYATVAHRELGGSKEHLRMERVRELLATEREYVKDLEALLQVAEERQTNMVQLPLMLANIHEVLEVAQQLVQGLDEALRGAGQEQQLGHLFLRNTEKLSRVYQEYCSHYSIHIVALLKKYEECAEAKEELASLARDLNSLRPHIITLNGALIKPVQRILRYPLYLDHLLEDMPSSHPDFALLQEAHMHLSEATTQINEYTRGLGLVSKCHSEEDQSLQNKMWRISLHSLAKKSTRMSVLLSQRLGILSQSECIELEQEEAKFHSMQSAALALLTHTRSLLEAVRARHASELLIAMGLGNTLDTPYTEAMKQAMIKACDQALKAFGSEVSQRVLEPARELAALCEPPARLIQKRHLKKLDYDAAQVKQSMKLEGSSSDKAKPWDKQEKVKAYEALQALLLAELPVLSHSGQAVVTMALHSLAAARLYLQGRMARIYLQLAQADSFPYMSQKVAQETAQKQVEWLLTLLPQSLQKKYMTKDHAGTVTLRKKGSTAPKNRRKSLPAEYMKGSTPALHITATHSLVHHTTSIFHVPLHQAEERHRVIEPSGEVQQEACLNRVPQGAEVLPRQGVTPPTFRRLAPLGNSEWQGARDVERRASAMPAVLCSDESQHISTVPDASQAAEVRQLHVAREKVETYTALYSYTAEDNTQLSLSSGQRVVALLKDTSEDWWFVKADTGKKGYVPAAYLTPSLG